MTKAGQMDTMTTKQSNGVGLVNFEKMSLALKSDAQKEAANKFVHAIWAEFHAKLEEDTSSWHSITLIEALGCTLLFQYDLDEANASVTERIVFQTPVADLTIQQSTLSATHTGVSIGFDKSGFACQVTGNVNFDTGVFSGDAKIGAPFLGSKSAHFEVHLW